MKSRLGEFVRLPVGRSIRHLKEQVRSLNEEMMQRVHTEMDMYKLNKKLRSVCTVIVILLLEKDCQW